MTIPRALGLVIIAGAGIIGAFIGRALPHDASSIQADARESPAPPGMTPAGGECEAERSALASTKAKLAICMAFDTADPKTAPSGVPEKSEPDPPAFSVQEIIEEEIRSYHERLESLSEAVIVRHRGAGATSARGCSSRGIRAPESAPRGEDTITRAAGTIACSSRRLLARASGAGATSARDCSSRRIRPAVSVLPEPGTTRRAAGTIPCSSADLSRLPRGPRGGLLGGSMRIRSRVARPPLARSGEHVV
jgi:hypothetical protein